MQTSIAPELANDPRVIEAEQILRKCVHCGFCLATCPTYNLLGDELDSPRGRIYLMKQVVEGQTPTATTQTHLDRCLTCRNCESTCPSGVEYSHLLDRGRSRVDERVERPWSQKLVRAGLNAVLPYRKRVKPLVLLGQSVRPILPAAIAAKVPQKQVAGPWPSAKHERVMLVLDGCVQASMTPATNAAAARVLDKLGVQLRNIESSGCCGAVSFHLGAEDDARDFMRRNIDAWWPAIEAGAEAVVTTASGCGVMVKDYGRELSSDSLYAEKAARVSELCVDIVEVLKRELLERDDLANYKPKAIEAGKIAFHPPCTLQHGQKLPMVTESLLRRLGFNLVAVRDSHICCGSAGTYSVTQPKLSKQLRDNKLSHLMANKPDIIATANIGCQLHVQSGTAVPVLHWVELIDKILNVAVSVPKS